MRLVTAHARPTLHAGAFVLALASVAYGADGFTAARGQDVCPHAENPAVRSSNPVTTALIASGIRLSPTFADQVRDLADTDVVALIEPRVAFPLELDAYLVFRSATTACRYVQVFYNAALNERRAIAIIGHELRHAFEIGMHPEVVDAASMRTMYRLYGELGDGEDRYESPEASAAGRTILQELLNGTSSRAVPAR